MIAGESDAQQLGRLLMRCPVTPKLRRGRRQRTLKKKTRPEISTDPITSSQTSTDLDDSEQESDDDEGQTSVVRHHWCDYIQHGRQEARVSEEAAGADDGR